MNFFKFLLPALTLMIGFPGAAQEDLLHNKSKNTLVDFSEIERYYERLNSLEGKPQDFNVYTSTFGYAVLVSSTGKSRDLSAERLQLLRMLFSSMNMPQDPAAYFDTEILVKTDAGNRWLPIQKNLLGAWKAEIAKGKPALILIRAFGSKNTIPEEKWMFTINSFITGHYDALWELALASFNAGDKENGLRCVKELISLDPNDGRNYSMYGYYYYDKGYPDNTPLLRKADSLYAKAIKLNPDYSYVYYQSALVKFQLGDYHSSWQAVEKARELQETYIEDFFLEKLEKKLPYKDYLKYK